MVFSCVGYLRKRKKINRCLSGYVCTSPFAEHNFAILSIKRFFYEGACTTASVKTQVLSTSIFIYCWRHENIFSVAAKR